MKTDLFETHFDEDAFYQKRREAYQNMLLGGRGGFHGTGIVHNLKIKEMYADEVLSGRKTFEVRKDDRGYAVGDKIKFSVINNASSVWYVSHDLSQKEYVITYILRNTEYVKKGYAVLAIKEVTTNAEKSL